MILSRKILVAAVALFALGLGGCQTTGQQEVLLSQKSSVELRAMQSRAFDTTDRLGTLRTVIATLQDLGYTIGKVEPEAGTVSADKFGYLHLTATVYPRGETQLIVRANVIVAVLVQRKTQVDSPEFYQKLFFEPLAQAMFLTALQVEEDPAPAPEGAPTPEPTQKTQHHAVPVPRLGVLTEG
jgi:hypothetical protein